MYGYGYVSKLIQTKQMQFDLELDLVVFRFSIAVKRSLSGYCISTRWKSSTSLGLY